MGDQPAYILDIDSLDQVSVDSGELQAAGKRRWLGVRFDCCHVYHRIYRNAAGTAYHGRCPKCCRVVNIRIGLKGTNCRFFRAD